MKILLLGATLAALLLVPPVVVEPGYQVTSVLHLVGTACDGGGGGW